jgi:phage tail sheath gpL-like
MAEALPRVTTNILSAVTAKTPDEHKILLIGQKNGGTATSGALVEGIISESQANTLFGRNSQIAKSARALFKNLSISRIRPQVAAISLDDNGAGVDATGTVTFAGTATAAGTITVYIDSLANGKYEIAVASGDTATVIGDALVTAITANLDSPVTAVNVTGTVTLTAVNAGTQGNTIGIKYDGVVAGVTTTLVAMASGATDPVLTTLFDPIADKRYNTIIYPAEWGTTTLTNFTEPRFNVDNNVLDGVGIVSVTDTYSNINTAVDALNQRTLAYIPNKIVADADHRGGSIFESPLVIAAQAAAYRGLRLTVNANISSIVTNGQAQGGFFFGGIPYHNTPFTNLPVIETGKDFTNTEADELETSGAWLLRNNPTNTVLISNEAVTTYKTDTLGNPDITFKFLNYVDTLSLVREYFFNNLKADFSQHILTTGKLIDGRPMVNAEGFTAAMMGYYSALSGDTGDNSYVLLRAGKAERDAFRDAIEQSIVINLSTGTITAESIANIVTQVRSIIINFTPTFE